MGYSWGPVAVRERDQAPAPLQALPSKSSKEPEGRHLPEKIRPRNRKPEVRSLPSSDEVLSKGNNSRMTQGVGPSSQTLQKICSPQGLKPNHHMTALFRG